MLKVVIKSGHMLVAYQRQTYSHEFNWQEWQTLFSNIFVQKPLANAIKLLKQ